MKENKYARYNETKDRRRKLNQKEIELKTFQNKVGKSRLWMTGCLPHIAALYFDVMLSSPIVVDTVRVCVCV